MRTVFKGRKVECELEWNGRAGRDPVDAFIGAAVYMDTGAALTETELDELQAESEDEIQEAAWLASVEGD